ncbi:hypothetical protein Pyrfu_0836 [Pyrolobus fumarii 1A]|uniref:Uncharacterized protein n=1 Tax=Pyrolobus fumarii (strain DSM 11204 / 1A) TaxID=694429 RepID=G0EDT6_PYRF1|nr:hypothetical protein [Pyrolobus fumarii]AEM38705.1 hypothetical protein Pyrfu_0836 [Pyrolobus fumarii 1A]
MIEAGLALLLVLSGASVAWFFPVRRYMIALIRDVSLELEEALNPVDKEYKLLGLYVGFHAKYRVRGLREVRALLVLTPRHALLYLPIVYVRGEHDILVLEAEPHGGIIGEECVIIRKATRPVRRVLARLGLANARLCGGRRGKMLTELLDSCSAGCLAAWITRMGVGIALRPAPGLAAYAARRLASLARNL